MDQNDVTNSSLKQTLEEHVEEIKEINDDEMDEIASHLAGINDHLADHINQSRKNIRRTVIGILLIIVVFVAVLIICSHLLGIKIFQF